MTTILSNSYKCLNCNKLHNDRAGLWRHNKKCNKSSPTVEATTDKDLMLLTLIKQNAEHTKQTAAQNAEHTIEQKDSTF